jgi:hypothetical protein
MSRNRCNQNIRPNEFKSFSIFSKTTDRIALLSRPYCDRFLEQRLILKVQKIPNKIIHIEPKTRFAFWSCRLLFHILIFSAFGSLLAFQLAFSCFHVLLSMPMLINCFSIPFYNILDRRSKSNKLVDAVDLSTTDKNENEHKHQKQQSVE